MKSSLASALESRNMIQYLDSHAHLLSEEYKDDFEEVCTRAADAQVNQIMLMCITAEEARRAIPLVRSNPQRFQAAYGIFMDDVDQADERYAEFEELIACEEIAAVGEIGLDYHWVKDNKEAQKELFIRQIESARKVHKPILVHSRDAMADTYTILKEHRINGLLHCYSGSLEMAQEFTKLGYYIALGGALTFKNARQSVEVCKGMDAKYLLSETDCPYMSPEPVRGRRNEPANIPYIVAKMAELREVPLEEMAATIQENYSRFLGPTNGN